MLHPSLHDFMPMAGEKFDILRNDSVIATIDGMRNSDKSNKKYIDFFPDADVQVDDWIKAASTKEEFLVINTEFQMGFSGKPFALKAYYKTKREHLMPKSIQPKSITFNIGNAHGSVIGNENYAPITNASSISEIKKLVESSNSPDKEELNQLVNMIELILEDKMPANKGVLSKFSELMERNSWITSPLTGALL